METSIWECIIAEKYLITDQIPPKHRAILKWKLLGFSQFDKLYLLDQIAVHSRKILGNQKMEPYPPFCGCLQAHFIIWNYILDWIWDLGLGTPPWMTTAQTKAMATILESTCILEVKLLNRILIIMSAGLKTLTRKYGKTLDHFMVSWNPSRSNCISYLRAMAHRTLLIYTKPCPVVLWLGVFKLRGSHFLRQTNKLLTSQFC